MNIAELTDTNLLWLITGQNYTQTPWLQAEHSIVTCLDDTMYPTLLKQTPVIIELHNSDHSITDGLYCLENSLGQFFRRIQWDEEKQGFWLICDNAKFEKQFCNTPIVIGKVISTLKPVS
ncbi:S24/S26 family peptidase [Vibrio sp. OPT18]|nr:S24/S26 family peptidase [Vibrio sp. OPT18]